MIKPKVLGVVLITIGLVVISAWSLSAAKSDAGEKRIPGLSVRYLEIVTNDVDSTIALYERLHGLSFGQSEPDLGHARIATGGGMLVGIRRPLAAHEQPIIRTYVAVDDIKQAVTAAEGLGATIAYPPAQQGQWGTFAIVIQGNIEHGLWQR